MPTANPRLSLTLQPLMAAQLSRLSELTGDSQSKIVTEILDLSSGSFAHLIQMLEAAKLATEEMKAQTGQNMRAAQHRLERQLGLMLDDLDESSAPLLAEVEQVRRRTRKGGLARDARPPASASAESTPISNRGVRSTKTKRKTTKTGGSHGSV